MITADSYSYIVVTTTNLNIKVNSYRTTALEEEYKGKFGPSQSSELQISDDQDPPRRNRNDTSYI